MHSTTAPGLAICFRFEASQFPNLVAVFFSTSCWSALNLSDDDEILTRQFRSSFFVQLGICKVDEIGLVSCKFDLMNLMV